MKYPYNIGYAVAEAIEVLTDLELDDIITLANLLHVAILKDKKIYIIGNGGSAADAQHFAAELTGRFQRERIGFPAIALTTDTSAITAIANDYGYENVFSRQVEALMKHGDILLALSTSGNSANIIKAAKEAKDRGALVFAFTGKKDSELHQISDLTIQIQSTNTARIQEGHMFALHLIAEILEEMHEDSSTCGAV